MTRPRKALISLADTPYYHITSRCVRRSFLCGFDKTSNTCYEHRRQWIVDRLRLLSSIFAIDICAYAVMSNHYHIVIKLQPEQAEEWDNNVIVDRWMNIYKGPLLLQRYKAGESLSAAEYATVSDIIQVLKQRLTNISWFMKCLNEPIARQANAEDNCTGHFWEARFKSQALISQEALLSCMAYVDLNPIRAQMADTPETSDYTSIQERITPSFNLNEAIQQEQQNGIVNDFELPLKPLLHFEGGIRNELQTGIPFAYEDYLQLVDWTGRIVRDDKRGSINKDLVLPQFCSHSS